MNIAEHCFARQLAQISNKHESIKRDSTSKYVRFASQITKFALKPQLSKFFFHPIKRVKGKTQPNETAKTAL